MIVKEREMNESLVSTPSLKLFFNGLQTRASCLKGNERIISWYTIAKSVV